MRRLLDIEYKGAYGSEPAAQMATREKHVKEIPPTLCKTYAQTLSLAKLERHLPLSSSPSIWHCESGLLSDFG